MSSVSRNLAATTFCLLLLTVASWTSPVFTGSNHLAILGFGRNIHQLPCKVTNQRGVCMFAMDCMKANGTHLGTCTDRFYLGSCCQLANSDDAQPVRKSSPHVYSPNEYPTALHYTGVRQPPTVPGLQYGPFLGSSELELPISINGLDEPVWTSVLGLQYVPFIAISELEQPSINGIEVPYLNSPLFGATFSSLWGAGSLSALPTLSSIVLPIITLPGIPELPPTTNFPPWLSSSSPSLPIIHVPEYTVVTPSSTASFTETYTNLTSVTVGRPELDTNLPSPSIPEISQSPVDLSNFKPEVAVVNTESSLDLGTIAATEPSGSVDASAVKPDTEASNGEVSTEPQVVTEVTDVRKISQSLTSTVSSFLESSTTTTTIAITMELSTKVSVSPPPSVSSTSSNQHLTTTEPIASYPTKDATLNNVNMSTSIVFPTEPVTLAPQALPTFPDYEKVCGRPVVPKGRVVGGSTTQFGEWPWQISLRHWQSSTFLHKCGAALLNENWAITAAHCVANVQPEDLLLRLGEYDLASEDETYPYVERKVQIVASHPQFDAWTFEYDLALLRFYDPVPYQPNILPICIPTEDEANETFVGRMATVTGWGRLYERPLPPKLQQVNVPVINNTDCEDMYRKAGYTRHIQNIFLCAGYADGKKDACEGDSGGPMVLYNKDRWVLAGVISWGIICAETNQPGVYTRITEFRDWINNMIVF